MRRQSLKSHLGLAATVVFILALPAVAVERTRGGVHALLRPLYMGAHYIQSCARQAYRVFSPPQFTDTSGKRHDPYEAALRLSAENHQLREEVIYLEELLQHERALNAQLAARPQAARENPTLANGALKYRSCATPARVICRAPSSWNSTLWIDLGTNNSPEPGITVNSPVLFGDAVVGVVEYVGQRQSRVRLISDPCIRPSVRIARGSSGSAHYLAKGELCGSGTALWQSRNSLLKGVGFNCDQADEWGPSRDLRTGTTEKGGNQGAALSLIEKGDLLITTGMDGVFPPGLAVAHVRHVYPLKEGCYTYDLEAEAAAGDLLSLHTVFVIPGLGSVATR